MQSSVYGALVIGAKANKSFDILKLFFLSDLVHRPVFKVKIKSRVEGHIRSSLSGREHVFRLRHVPYFIFTGST